MKCTARRGGFTLLELLVTMTIIIILGAILAPTIMGVAGDSPIKQTTDQIRGDIANARSHAILEGQPYRMAISPDGTQVRVLPATWSSPQDRQPMPDGLQLSPLVVEASLPKGVTVQPIATEEMPALNDAAGWQYVATFLPNGSCQERLTTIRILSGDSTPRVIQLRGLTGVTSVAFENQSVSEVSP